jgi:hypothetical protein
VDHGVDFVIAESHGNRTAPGGWMMRLVCAQHGHVVNGVEVPCRNTKHEKKMNILLSEANSERVTDSGKEGYEKIAS